MTKSQEWHQRAQQVIPGGVSSPVRAFKAVGGTPIYFVKGAGSKVWDLDGNEYIDLVGSWGPMILGHAHPEVIQKTQQALQDSFSFGAPTFQETLLAEEIIKRVEAIDKVRFVSSGTEAVMTAIRLARAATKKNKIIKFAGCYHGHTDSMLVKSGSGVATLDIQNSPGVTNGSTEDTIVVEYNNLDQVKAAFEQYEIAAIITEATPANMGVVPPQPNFNKLLKELAEKNNALLILDEVMTGFRISKGGWWGKFGKAEGWTPDLFTYGKVIGGGMPLAAIAGKQEIMDLLAPLGNVYQAGTLSGNPVATTAGLTTLQNCTDELYENLDLRAKQVGEGIHQALSKHNIKHSYQSAGNLFSFFFTDKPVTNFAEAQEQDTKAFAIFFHEMLKQGISIPPSAYEAWFVSNALTDDDVEKIIRAADAAAKILS